MNDEERLRIYLELDEELRRAGAVDKYTKKSVLHFSGAMNAIINGPYSARPYVDIILKYADQLDYVGKAVCARALSEKGIKNAAHFMLSIFDELKDAAIPKEVDLWGVGNALYTIDDKSSYDGILAVCWNKHYGSARQMLMGSLARMKTQKSYECLIDCLGDETVKAHAIEGLGRFGNVDAIPILERINVKKGLYEYKAKNTALRRLNRKLEKLQSH